MCIKNLMRGQWGSIKKKLDSFTLEISKNHLISTFLRNGRLRVKMNFGPFERKLILCHATRYHIKVFCATMTYDNLVFYISPQDCLINSHHSLNKIWILVGYTEHPISNRDSDTECDSDRHSYQSLSRNVRKWARLRPSRNRDSRPHTNLTIPHPLLEKSFFP